MIVDPWLGVWHLIWSSWCFCFFQTPRGSWPPLNDDPRLQFWAERPLCSLDCHLGRRRSPRTCWSRTQGPWEDHFSGRSGTRARWRRQHTLRCRWRRLPAGQASPRRPALLWNLQSGPSHCQGQIQSLFGRQTHSSSLNLFCPLCRGQPNLLWWGHLESDHQLWPKDLEREKLLRVDKKQSRPVFVSIWWQMFLSAHGYNLFPKSCPCPQQQWPDNNANMQQTKTLMSNISCSACCRRY